MAAETARFLGVQHDIVRTTEPLLDSLRNHTRYFQEPVRNPLNMGWYAEIERRAAKRGAKVLLTGELGNLTLSAGGLWQLAEWVHKRAWATWLTEAAAAAWRPDVTWRGVLFGSFGPSMPAWVNEQLLRIFVGQPPWRSACFVRPEILAKLPRRANKRVRRPVLQRLGIMRGYDPGVFRKGSLARHGVDERDPTADLRLIEFALRLPSEHLIYRGIYKPLAREALSDRLPPFVLDLPVRGYQGADWISHVSRQSALATLEGFLPTRRWRP